MASRENQGLQLSLIFFVAVTVALSVACYFFWKKGDEARIAAEQAESQKIQAQEGQRLAEAESRSIKLLMGGYPAETTLAQIEEDHATDMAYYGQVLQRPIDNYRTLVTLYEPEWVRISQDIIAAESNLQARSADLASAQAQEQENVAAATAAQQDITESRDESLASNQESLDETLELQPRAATLIAAFGDRAGEATTEALEERDEWKDLAQTQQETIDRLQRQLAGLHGEAIDNHDAVVTMVNPGSNTVYVNVGSADFLQRQMTFSVFDSTASNLATAEPKGAIEITNVLEPHLAEAKILGDNLEDPILTGDLIFSPIWQPGQQLHFGLAGVLDINGDGDDDIDQVRRLITLNGGVVDEGPMIDMETGELLVDEDTGDQLIGAQISPSTRYLVVGTPPTEVSSKAERTAYTTVQSQAREIGVQQISLARLLDLMGYHGAERPVGLGRHADPDDFRPQPGDENFRQRRPGGTPRSAYP